MIKKIKALEKEKQDARKDAKIEAKKKKNLKNSEKRINQKNY